MASEQIPRSSIDPSRHASVDSELKTLKLHTRRLQSVLTTQATELQVLQRLYYKNKNQHRGALFWRNVVEIRRFLERVEQLNLLELINGLRSMFYETQNINSSKGPWTYFPSAHYLLKFSDKCQTAITLLEKMEERCLNAYRSFHRSMQTAAFLQILLMFVAIASRTRTLAIELGDILRHIKSSITRLDSVLTKSIVHQDEKIYTTSTGTTSIPEPQLMELDPMQSFSHSISTESDLVSTRQQPFQQIPISLFSSLKPENPSQQVILEKSVIQRTRKDTTQSTEPAAPPKKKKRKTPRNEIDDIFGF